MKILFLNGENETHQFLTEGFGPYLPFEKVEPKSK
jgi:hypothetical protein